MTAGSSHIIEVTPRGDILVLAVAAGQLTALPAIDRFDAELRRLAEDRGERNWILDFHEVTFIVTPAINTLLALMKKLRAEGGDLVLTGLSREIRHILELMRLDEVLALAPDEAAALKEFNKTR